MFKYKTEAELNAMTSEQRDTYAEQKRAFEATQTKEAIKTALDEFKAANPAPAAVEMPITKEEVAELKETIAQLKEAGIGSAQKEKPLRDQLKENKDKLKAMASGTSKTDDEVVVKTLLQRSAIANNDLAVDLPDIGQLATRKLSLYDLFPKYTVGAGNHNGTVRYYDWDEDTIVRSAAAVAETGSFPASKATWKRGTVTLQKIGDSLPVTEEFFEDETLFASELGMFLETNVALEVDRQLADGDGTGNTITGLKASVNAYTPVASGIVDPSIYDLLVKVSESITKTGGAKYSPDFAVMNITDINAMKLKKDANYNYIIPPFVSRDGAQVAGIVVIESNIITADTMVVGDRRFARIYEMGGVVLSKGIVSTQFTDDEMTLKARKRMAFLIRAADKGGFAKVTSIATALTTLAS